MTVNKSSGPIADLLDVAIIGAGPAGVSVAAHLKGKSDLSFRVFERRSNAQWHRGMLFNANSLQSSHFKDLVFLSDPRHDLTFFRFLHSKNRLYRYIHAGYETPSRAEFNEYIEWAVGELGEAVQFASEVKAIETKPDRFKIVFHDSEIWTRNLVLSAGTTPRTPINLAAFDGRQVFHSSDYAYRSEPRGNFCEKRVLIVGGGQSGAEVLRDVISNKTRLPSSVLWLTRSFEYPMFDDSVFASDLYTPTFFEHFTRQSPNARRHLTRIHKKTSDGVIPALFKEIYQSVYSIDISESIDCDVRGKVGHEVTSIEQRNDGSVVVHCGTGYGEQSYQADIVILATGYSHETRLLDSILNAAGVEIDQVRPNPDFSIDLPQHNQGKLFIQNASVDLFGWVDPNLGGASMRSARIVNSIAGETLYVNADDRTFVDWN